MNLLSPDDIINGSRRKSLCNGAILTLAKNATTPSKKKERRRGSFSEPQQRRASLVSRWFKHISDAAEQYKPRSKSSHEVVEDPASTTLPHSNTKESFESTPDRTTSVTGNNNNFTGDTSGYQPDHSHIQNNSTPYEKTKNNLVNNNSSADNQKDRYESNNNATNEDRDGNEKENVRQSREDARRDSVYSNNSNNTRTLMQHCPLLEPSEIHISISPALTAEPILTPTERLKRLDEAIRERLAEKQKIICDMFRVPNEHFAAIADIASQPEAPKDTSDIVLAAFAQVQSLTEVLSEYMKVTPEQEISAVSTAVCDQCHQRNLRSVSPIPSSIASTNTGTTIIPNSEGNKDQLDDTIIQEDDGYCEIDALRLPSVTPNPMNTSGMKPISGAHVSTSTPELTKRQSTISADSIPEETEHEMTHDGLINNSKSTEKEQSSTISDLPSEDQQKASDDSLSSEHIEVNDAYDTTISSMTKALPESNYESTEVPNNSISGNDDYCGPNRFSHVNSLEPSIPCHVIGAIVTALSTQISLLLPKINERDLERERLRRENQNLRELLNEMHERQRVDEEKETPETTKSAEKSDQISEETESSELSTENHERSETQE